MSRILEDPNRSIYREHISVGLVCYVKFLDLQNIKLKDGQ